MLLINVFFHLKIGNEKYLKQEEIHFIPRVGDHLKIVNHSFVVEEVEHDLDGYSSKDYKMGCACHSIKAAPSERMYTPDDFHSLNEEIQKAGWKSAKK